MRHLIAFVLLFGCSLVALAQEAAPGHARTVREFVAAANRQDVEAMIAAAESLFGPYDWERFDLLVMPPSFPYGGMENPRLTFLTPTIVAGDRSLVNVVAHELSHSWTGNLVSNATAEHFWLNEGFTVYAERRILERIAGREEAELHAAVGRTELLRTLDELAGQPELTRLRGQLEGIDPDHAFSIVPYEKGYLLLQRRDGADAAPMPAAAATTIDAAVGEWVDVPAHASALLMHADLVQNGYGKVFSDHITQANQGCDFDFLHAGAPTPDPDTHH